MAHLLAVVKARNLARGGECGASIVRSIGRACTCEGRRSPTA